MGKRKIRCRDRILNALRYEEKMPQQIADELFVHRISVRLHLLELLVEGKVDRKFRPNASTHMPDYVYSSVKYPPKYRSATPEPSGLLNAVGGWDSFDIRKWKK